MEFVLVSSFCLLWTYIFLVKIVTNKLKMERKFAINSVMNIYSKMWELCMHPDYRHFIPLTSK